MLYQAVIGLEVHAELETRSKMFCSCPVVDVTQAEPNLAVCPICAGMPGVLPVVNRRAVEFALRVALALNCEIAHTSIFARKNYFYPDLPKGYQISQYEMPLARNGQIQILTSQGERIIRIRRVHLEEDTGKLTHILEQGEGEAGTPRHSLVDLNRAGIPLLEIVTEPDFHTAEEVKVYAASIRTLLRYLKVNSGDMQKGVLRIEPNISLRPNGSSTLGTRVEVKNLNSLRALERSVEYEINRQAALLDQGYPIQQETVGWDEIREITFTQRVKEGEEDYRYFPEPDLPPLVVDEEWLEQIRNELPELPTIRLKRFRDQYGLSEYDASILVAEKAVADYYEQLAEAAPELPPKGIANWITGDLFGLMNKTGNPIEMVKVSPLELAELLKIVFEGSINKSTGKSVLSEMYATGEPASVIVQRHGHQQISDILVISNLVENVVNQHPESVREYLQGKNSILQWLFGQVMKSAKGQANPQVVQSELEKQLKQRKQADR
jgi:aspartyl-tRNA(Asn)/glutamyl-tRNA(Gln) amidotransferase subunit B